MHVVLATFGTDGDVYPYLGFGRHLVERGYRVTLASSPHYREAATAYGIKFHDLIDRREIDSVLWNPDFWHPLKAGQLAAKWGLKFLPQQYTLLTELTQELGTILVANPGVLAARIVHDKFQMPFASLVLQPWLLQSVHQPAIIPGGLTLPKWAPRWTWKLQHVLLHRFGDYLLAPAVNALRGSLGLAPVKRVLRWWLSPQLVLGLFPEWYGPPLPDWPPQVRLLTFPTFDGTTDAQLSRELSSFISAGDAPVAITFGTGIRHARDLYRCAVEACRQLGRRTIVLTKYPEQVPQPLPAEVIAVPYAPFSALFPKCSAVIHHGGIGTTAKALLAALPQLIIPVCFDQLDNGVRVQALGRGTVLSRRRPTSQQIAERLSLLNQLGPLSVVQGAEKSAFELASEMLQATYGGVVKCP